MSTWTRGVYAEIADGMFAVVSVQQFLIAAALYLPGVFLLRAAMKNRAPFDLKGVLFVWNSTLSVLSGIGAFYTWRDLFWPLVVGGSLCNTSIYEHSSSWYLIFFNLTKAVEWGDTVFLVLRHKRLGFLHLFHHLCTMLYCLHATLYSVHADGSGVVFGGMNMFVHFLMYGYWALLPSVPKLRRFGFLITLLQTTQMVVGLLTVLWCTLMCPLSWQNNWHGDLFALGMYFVYFYLFFQLASQKVDHLRSTPRPD